MVFLLIVAVDLAKLDGPGSRNCDAGSEQEKKIGQYHLKIPLADRQSMLVNTLKWLTILVNIFGHHQGLEDAIEKHSFGLFTNERETTSTMRTDNAA